LLNSEYAAKDKGRHGKDENADNPASAAQRHHLFLRQPLKIVEDRGNQLLPAGIVCGQRRSKEIEEIARFLGRFRPIRSRRRDELSFQFVLPKAQGLLVGFYVCEQPAEVGGLLSGHPPMLVQIDRLFRHVREVSGLAHRRWNAQVDTRL
jgi:hypothetical protein